MSWRARASGNPFGIACWQGFDRHESDVPGHSPIRCDDRLLSNERGAGSGPETDFRAGRRGCSRSRQRRSCLGHAEARGRTPERESRDHLENDQGRTASPSGDSPRDLALSVGRNYAAYTTWDRLFSGLPSGAGGFRHPFGRLKLLQFGRLSHSVRSGYFIECARQGAPAGQ